MNLPKDREAEARKEAGVGIGLADDLRSIRTALVKARLAGDFEAAFDLMLFQLGRSVFTDGYKSHALDIAVRETADRPTMRMNDADFASWSPGEAMLEDRSGLSASTGWRSRTTASPSRRCVNSHRARNRRCSPPASRAR